MFAKSFIAALFLVSSFAGSAHAHAGVSPALGVQGTLARADIQRPNNARVCGRVDIASNLDTSTPIVANTDGTFDTQITNFNR